MKTAEELIKLLDLEPKKDQIFLGQSKSVGSAHVYGGQALAQALNAAYKCVPEDRILHSLHSYFILPGDLEQPIEYKVEKIRDGGSFSTRRVLAHQNNGVMFILACSFKLPNQGYEFQGKAPEVPLPEDLYSVEEVYEQAKDFLPESVKKFLEVEIPMSLKPTVMPNPLEKKKLQPEQYIWFKVKGNAPKEIALKQQILTYISDYNILATAMRPHADVAHWGNTMVASIDHSMWFHRAFDMEDWLLYSLKCTNTNNEVGLVTGEIFNRAGELIASVAQQGLLRVKK